MQTSTHNDPLIEFNPSRALGLRLKQWLTPLVLAFGLSASVNAQLAVVNGNFSDLTGLTDQGGGWWAGDPNGWDAQIPTAQYAVNLWYGEYVCNLRTLGAISQTVGTLTNTTDVILSFDDTAAFNSPNSFTAYILDSSYNTLATGTFSVGLGQNLVATSVPVGTTIVIQFTWVDNNPALANISAMTLNPSAPPVITQQPVSSSALPVATAATLSVAALGVPTLAYQWRSNGVPVTGATSAMLSVTNPGSYTVVVTAGNSLSVTSAVAQVIRTNDVPVLNGNFTSDHLGAGGDWAGLGTPSATSGWDGNSSPYALNHDRFGVWTVFLSNYSPNYDFHLNLTGPAIVEVSFEAGYADQSGTTVTATLTVGGTPISQPFTIGQALGSYVAVFTNTTETGDMVLGFTGAGSFLTHVSSLSFFGLTDKPVITQQPASSSALPPVTAVILSVGVIGVPPLGCQWRSNGVPLTGATSTTLSVTNPGSYTAVITSGNSLSVTSTVAQVIRTDVVPVLNGDFTSDHIGGGAWAGLSTPSATSGWNGNTSAYALNHDRFGIWTVFLSAYSPNYDFHLSLTGPAIVVVSFQAGYADQGGTTVTATLNVGGTPIIQPFTIGQTLGSYMAVFTNTTATGDMVLGFTGPNTFLTAVSSLGVFTPTAKPVITQQPSSFSLIMPGATLNLSVTAVGIPPLTYQWQTNGVALSAQTSATLSISNTTPANSGNYTVVVSNSNGSVISSVAQVTVVGTPPVTIISDPLNGTGLLNGTTPVSRGGVGSHPWGAGTNLVMDGTQVSEVHAYDSGFVPFSPEADNIYTLSCEMDIISGDWIGLAFSQNANANVYNGFFTSGNILQGWMCQVQNGSYYLFTGPEIGTGVGSPTVSPGIHSNAIVLNTVGQNWTFQFFVDGIAVGVPAAYSLTPGVNPAIGYVGIGNSDNAVAKNGNTGTYRNFALNAVLARSIPRLSIVPNGVNVTVSWPTAAAGWVLVTTPSLSAPSWTAVPGVANNSVTVTAGGGNAFFHLLSTY